MVWAEAIVLRPCALHQQASQHVLCNAGLRDHCLPHGRGNPAETKHAVGGATPATAPRPALALGVLSCARGGWVGPIPIAPREGLQQALDRMLRVQGGDLEKGPVQAVQE